MTGTSNTSPFFIEAEKTDNEILKGVLVCAHEYLSGSYPAVTQSEIINHAIGYAVEAAAMSRANSTLALFTTQHICARVSSGAFATFPNRASAADAGAVVRS